MKRYYSVGIVCTLISSILLSGCGARRYITDNQMQGFAAEQANLNSDVSDCTDETNTDGSDSTTQGTVTECVTVTDSNGNSVTDSSGKAVTEVINVPITTDAQGNVVTQANNNTSNVSTPSDNVTTQPIVNETTVTVPQTTTTTTEVKEVDGHRIESVKYLVNLNYQGVTVRYDKYYKDDYNRRILYSTYDKKFEMSSLSDPNDNSAITKNLLDIGVSQKYIKYLIGIFHGGAVAGCDECGTYDDVSLDALYWNHVEVHHHYYKINSDGKKVRLSSSSIKINAYSEHSYLLEKVQTEDYYNLIIDAMGFGDFRYVQELTGC